MKTNHLPDKNGFKVPKDYFESFEERLNTQLFLDDKKVSGFKMPDSYLQGFKVTIPQEDSSKVVSLFNRKSIIGFTSIAATIALLLTLTLNKKQTNLDNLDSDILSAYVLEEVESDDLNLFLDDISLNETDFIELQTTNLEEVINDIELEDLIQ